VRRPGFEPGIAGLAGRPSPSRLELPRESRLTSEFERWLKERGLQPDTIQYYVSVVSRWDGGIPESRAQRKALRQYLQFLYEAGLIGREKYLELRDRLRIGGYKPSKETQRAISLEEVLEPLERLPENLRVVWLIGLYSGARLSHVLEALAGWNPGEEVVVLGVVRRKRLECVDGVCTYWLGSIHGRKKQYELYLPEWLAGSIRPVQLSYNIKDILYHRYGARYSILRKYANQRLAELAVKHSFPEDAWRWILSRDISVSGRHYLNLHDLALRLYRLYAEELDRVIPPGLRGSG
jgi:intergrase/recombinase